MRPTETEFGVGESIELSDGVLIQNLNVAVDDAAHEAKIGSVCTVYYQGKLASDNQVFDEVVFGCGFTFKLGADEVIRGWDIGVVGMKVGSKRRITCPPAVAFGTEGRPPAIQSNATLIFDIFLLNVVD